MKAARHRAWRPAKNVLLLLLLAGLAYFYTHDYSKRAKGTDFPDFYTAARMVSEGFGHQLYDAQLKKNSSFVMWDVPERITSAHHLRH